MQKGNEPKGKRTPPDPKPDDGKMFCDGDDHESLPNAEPGGGRGPDWPYAYPATATRCTANSKQRSNAARKAGLIEGDQHRRCRNVATSTTNKCRFHGGTVRKKAEGKGGWYGNFKTGRYSKKLGKLAEAYEAALDSPTLLDMRECIAVLDACVQRVMERVDQLDTPDFRRRSVAMYRESRRLLNEGKGPEAGAVLNELGALLERGADEDKSTALLISAVETLQKRIEEAWKIKLTKDEVMNTRDMIGVMGRWIEVILDESDVDVGARIVGRLDGMMRGLGAGLRKTPG